MVMGTTLYCVNCIMTSLFLLNISYSGLTRPQPTEMTMLTTNNYALRTVPKNYRIPKPSSDDSSYVPITNTDYSNEEKPCLYESKIYPGLMIPCPSRFQMPINYQQQDKEVDYDQVNVDDANVDDRNPEVNEELDDKADYDYLKNQNQDEYEDESPQSQPQDTNEEFEKLSNRVKCKGKKCNQQNNDYKNEENESQENENENEENHEDHTSQEQSSNSKENKQNPLPKPKPKPKPKPPTPKPTTKPTTPRPKIPDLKIKTLKPLTIIHNYQPANFTLVTKPKEEKTINEDKNKDDNEEENTEENSQESRLEDVEEYNEGDNLQDDEYYYDDEDYDQIPKKPKIPKKLTDIDDMKFNSEEDEPSESIYKNTILKNVSKTFDVSLTKHKPYNPESSRMHSTPQKPKPYDSAAEAYTRIKDKNKPQDQQIMQMIVQETTVAFNLIDGQKNKYKLPTYTDSTTVSTKYRPRPTVRPNTLKR